MKKLTDLFALLIAVSQQEKDIEDLCSPETSSQTRPVVATVTRKRARDEDNIENIGRHWREVLGNPPSTGSTNEELARWIDFHKRKWTYQKNQRDQLKKLTKRVARASAIPTSPTATQMAKRTRLGGTNGAGINTLGNFLRKAQQTLLNSPWQVIQVIVAHHTDVFPKKKDRRKTIFKRHVHLFTKCLC